MIWRHQVQRRARGCRESAGLGSTNPGNPETAEQVWKLEEPGQLYLLTVNYSYTSLFPSLSHSLIPTSKR